MRLVRKPALTDRPGDVDALRLALASLAAFRVWRLLGRDEIVSTLRARLPGRVQGMLACPWCSGFWIAGAVAWLVGARGWKLGVVWLAISAVIGLLSRVDGD